MPDTTSSEVTDTSSTGTDASMTPATPETSAPSPQASAEPTGVQATTPQDKASALPITDTRSQTNQQTQQVADQNAAPVDMQKRYDDLRAYTNRINQQFQAQQQQMKRFEGINPDEYRNLQQQLQQQRAQSQALQQKPWHPAHPDHRMTHDRISRVQQFIADRDNINANPSIPPEAKGPTIAALAQSRGITNQDAELNRDFENANREDEQRWRQDKRGFIEQAMQPIIQQSIQNAFQQFEQYMQTRQETQAIVNDPRNAQLMEHYAPDMLRVLDANTPRRQVAMDYAQIKAERDALRAQLSKQAETVHSAAAQQDSLRTRATVKRDGRTVPTTTDPVEEAQKKGLTGAQLLDFLEQKRQAQMPG